MDLCVILWMEFPIDISLYIHDDLCLSLGSGRESVLDIKISHSLSVETMESSVRMQSETSRIHKAECLKRTIDAANISFLLFLD
jgi:hypothetical protein